MQNQTINLIQLKIRKVFSLEFLEEELRDINLERGAQTENSPFNVLTLLDV
jgi:hypothetical protein